jgi:hypothetical protein
MFLRNNNTNKLQKSCVCISSVYEDICLFFQTVVNFQASDIISKKTGSVKLIPEYSVSTCILCIYLFSFWEKLSNLSQITSKIHTIAMFLTVEFRKNI